MAEEESKRDIASKTPIGENSPDGQAEAREKDEALSPGESTQTVLNTARLIKQISEESFEKDSSIVRYRNYLIKNTLKGLALGFICDSYLFGKDYFIYVFQVIYSALFAKFEMLDEFLHNPPDSKILLENLGNTEYLFIGSLILISCIAFGLWDGWREDRIRSLALRDRERGQRLLGASKKLAHINETLERLSITDDLTGLFNRRYANQQLSYELSKSQRFKQPLCVMMVDIDHFKHINDTFGHETGDIVLKQISQIMINAVRKEDIVCRYGGEEFLLILPTIDQNSAKTVGKRLLEHISRESFVIKGNDIPLTVSIGLAGLSDEFTIDYLELVRKADVALYKAKNAGRNRLCNFAREDMDEFVEMFTFQPEKRLEDLSVRINDLRKDLRESAISAIQTLINAVGTRDVTLLKHMRETAYHARFTAVAAGLHDEDVDTIFRAALLHDIGKIGVPDTLLTKEGKLEPHERIVIEQHPELGSRILAPLGFMRVEAQIVKYHHERFDGLGYPEGISGDSIPIGAAIISVCSAYDFMMTRHPYRNALTETEARDEIRRGKGSQFDPRAVDAFLDYISNTQRYMKPN